jgi:outer membrane immunogenic protein
MKISSLALAIGFSAVIGIGAASAADLAARPYTKAPPIAPVAVYDWSGFYIGINGGGGLSHKCWDMTSFLVRNPAFALQPEGCHDATGGVAGGQVGYRWQSASWVFGVEAQGDWANLRGSNPSTAFALGAGAPLVNNQTTIDAFGLLTGQIGYAANNVLFYAKGGAAVVSDKYAGTFITTGRPFDGASETRWGGVVGVGLEYGFAPNWSVAAEYDHLFMGTKNIDSFGTNPTALIPALGVYSRTDRIRQDVDLFTVRVNYRFGGPVVAKY